MLHRNVTDNSKENHWPCWKSKHITLMDLKRTPVLLYHFHFLCPCLFSTLVPTYCLALINSGEVSSMSVQFGSRAVESDPP